MDIVWATLPCSIVIIFFVYFLLFLLLSRQLTYQVTCFRLSYCMFSSYYYLVVREEGQKSVVKRKKPTKCSKKKAWSRTEVKAVLSHLGNVIRQLKVPGKDKIMECKKFNSEALIERSWTDIKYFAYNYIKKFKKNGASESFK